MYAKAIGYFCVLSVIVFYAGSNGFNISSSQWLSKWSDQASANETDLPFRLGVYAALGLGQGERQELRRANHFKLFSTPLRFYYILWCLDNDLLDGVGLGYSSLSDAPCSHEFTRVFLRCHTTGTYSKSMRKGGVLML